MKVLIQDRKTLDESGSMYQLPPGLSDEAYDVGIAIGKLRSRVLDPTLRAAISDFHASCSKAEVTPIMLQTAGRSPKEIVQESSRSNASSATATARSSSSSANGCAPNSTVEISPAPAGRRNRRPRSDKSDCACPVGSARTGVDPLPRSDDHFEHSDLVIREGKRSLRAQVPAEPRQPAVACVSWCVLEAVPYADQLLTELEQIRAAFVDVLERSQISATDLPTNFIGFPFYRWAGSSDSLQVDRMTLLGQVRDFRTRFELLFPHPTPEVSKRHDDALDHLERWLGRGKSDHSIPANIPAAVASANASVDVLAAAKGLLPADEFATRLTVDTNVLLDDLDLAQFTAQLGGRCMAHVLPVVLSELDDLKRSGRTESLRDAAKKADRRLKGLRDNGDVSVGAKVVGEVWAVFEHIEPRGGGLPSWLQLDVPDDRFIASTLLLQSRHPGSMLVAATGDLNLQTKLAAVRLPFIEPA